MIINKGQIVANGKPEELKQQISSDIILMVKFNQALSDAQLKELRGFGEVKPIAGAEYQLVGKDEEAMKALVFNFAVKNQLMLSEMKVNENSLEDIFKNVTR